MTSPRYTHRTLLGAVGLVLAATASLAAQTTTPSSPDGATPRAWLQLRNDTNNTGAIPGGWAASWRFKAPRPVRGLSVADGVVVMGTESHDADANELSKDQRGYLFALDAATGRQLWTAEVPSWVHGDPAIYGGRAYVTYGQFPIVSPGGVSAYNLRTGQRVWEFPTVVGAMPAPAVDTINGTLIVVGGDGVLHELALDTGKPVHEAGLRAVVAMSSPRISADRHAYFAAGRTLMRYDLGAHTLGWRVRLPPLLSLGDIPVALTDTAVFTAGYGTVSLVEAFRALPVGKFFKLARTAWKDRPWAARNDWFAQQWIAAIDRRDGRLLWKASLGHGLYVSRNASGTPVTAGNAVVISSPFSKTLRVFDAGTGRERWMRDLVDMHKGAVTIIGDEVFVGDRKGALSIYALADGTMKGRCSAGAPFTVLAPVLVGKTLMIATKDGSVVAAPFDSVRTRALSKGKCY